jgi:hypothetical protein
VEPYAESLLKSLKKRFLQLRQADTPAHHFSYAGSPLAENSHGLVSAADRWESKNREEQSRVKADGERAMLQQNIASSELGASGYLAALARQIAEA